MVLYAVTDRGRLLETVLGRAVVGSAHRPGSAPLELPLLTRHRRRRAGRRQGSRGREWLRLARRAKLLSWVCSATMTLRGAVAIAAGVVAGSVALIGFGIDSGSRASPPW